MKSTTQAMLLFDLYTSCGTLNPSLVTAEAESKEVKLNNEGAPDADLRQAQ